MAKFLETLVKLLELFKYIIPSYDLLDKVSKRKYLEFKSIYNDPYSEEVKNIAKGELEALQFEKLTKIKTRPELISPLSKLITESKNPEQTELDIRSSSSFIVRSSDNFLEIRPEENYEKMNRIFVSMIAYFFLFLSICVLLISVTQENTDIKILLHIFFILLLFFELYLCSLTSYFHSNKRLAKKIILIRNNENLNKRRSWLNILGR
jgi:hypothetical protein